MTDTPSREERLLMPITAWRDLGYEGPLSHEQVVDALWKLGEYSPEGVAVERTVAQLRADLAHEKERNPHRVVCPACGASLPCASCAGYADLFDKAGAVLEAATGQRAVRTNLVALCTAASERVRVAREALAEIAGDDPDDGCRQGHPKFAFEALERTKP